MSLVGALQQALATEHEAVYGYGVVGAHSPVIAPLTRSATQHKQVGDRLIEHKVLRDALEELIRRLGATPVAAQVAYQLPFPVHARRAAARLARQLEEACEQAAWAVISASRAESPARRLMVRALAANWRAHSGSGTGPEPGAFEISEDDEKFTFAMNPCGSGQRAPSGTQPRLDAAGR